MGKIEELINRLAHTKVQTVPLWSVTAWDKKFNAVDKAMQKKIVRYKYLLAKDLEKLVVPNGTIRILYTTKDVAYTTEKLASGYISEGEVVAIPWGGNPTVKYYNGKFVTGDNRIVTALDKTTLDNKYLFYWMDCETKTLASFYRGAGIKHPSMVSVLTMEIPLPPLAVQKEIVEILDTFTRMIDNLQKELEQRQKQFEYYRSKFFAYNEDECDWFSLPMISENCDRKRKPIKGSKRENGIYPYYGASGIVDYVKDYILDGDYLLISEDGANLVARNTPIAFSIEGKNWVNNHAHVVKFNSLNDQRFVEYYFNSIDLTPWISGGAQPKLNQENLNKILIPYPSVEKRNIIVDTLKSFEALISNIKQEIELRQKQYEYYRGKLLTFE